MKAIYAHFAGALGLTFALAACIPPSPEPSPAPERTPAAQDAVPEISLPAAGPDPAYANWMDAPRTPGDWSYSREAGGSVARYGEPQRETRFAMRCDRANGRIVLSRAALNASGATTMTIRTETADRSLQAQPTRDPLEVMASVEIRDPLLDAMALTKGRFAVETAGDPNLYLPAWAEVTRVIEDCR